MEVRILGCGTSSGVPRVGNDWGTVAVIVGLLLVAGGMALTR